MDKVWIVSLQIRIRYISFRYWSSLVGRLEHTRTFWTTQGYYKLEQVFLYSVHPIKTFKIKFYAKIGLDRRGWDLWESCCPCMSAIRSTRGFCELLVKACGLCGNNPLFLVWSSIAYFITCDYCPPSCV